MPSSSQSRRAVFGPRPGSRMNDATSDGTSAFFFVSAWISPSSTTCTIFSSIVLPIPCSSFARPSRASWATELPVSRMRVAARRYAVTRKASAPSSSIRSASRSNCAARSGFLGSVRATTSMIRSLVRATVCLPTYNERENLERMVGALGAVFRDGDRVLVIDDGSPDGTGELADRLSAELGFVDVLHRPRKGGLGPAYLAGFRRALDDGAELVLEMDCDFSHDPKDVPRLIAAAEEGADLVLGSRYVRGGSIPNWGALSRFVSLGGNLYAQVLRQSRIRDLTGCFKCFRLRVLETIPLDEIDSKGYAFQIETTYRVHRAGFRVVEIPIAFTDREQGTSKMNGAIVLVAVWKVPLIRLRALAGRL